MPQHSPAVGQPAPSVRLSDETGKTVDLSEYRGKSPVVLFFYPKADTPGCTIEACAFRDAIASYQQLSVPVYGISPDPVADVKAFADKFNLNFPLLADTDHKVSEAYGTWVEKQYQGKHGVARTTFVIGKDGTVAHVFENVQPQGHDVEVLEWLRSHPTT